MDDLKLSVQLILNCDSGFKSSNSFISTDEYNQINVFPLPKVLLFGGNTQWSDFWKLSYEISSDGLLLKTEQSSWRFVFLTILYPIFREVSNRPTYIMQIVIHNVVYKVLGIYVAFVRAASKIIY
jgi:hypothetical protein